MEPIKIRTLGEFSLSADGAEISDAGSRSRKVWCLLAYLVCSRDRSVSQKKLIEVLWGDESASSNPENALRITLHRLRTALDQLWESAGRDLIVHKDGGYGWNSDFPVELDCDRFDALISAEYQDEDQKLDAFLQALELYRGEFLPKHNSELWVIPIASHFHNRFLTISMETSGLLMKRHRYDEAETICRKAAAAEPYHEGVHQLLMRILGAKGDAKGAAAVYDALQKRLFDDFGIRPSDETREVYRASAHGVEDRTLPMDEVLEDIHEPDAATSSGAMVCDYDYFKVLCFSESRSMERNGHATHVALLSVVSLTGDPLPKRSLDRVMDQLEENLRIHLRRGDTISRCSVSQYIMMLPKANYENSCMVCRRVLAAFHQSHPRMAVKINYMVQPLTPSVCVP